MPWAEADSPSTSVPAFIPAALRFSGADRGVAEPRLTGTGKEPVPSVGAVAPPALPLLRSLSEMFPHACRAGGWRAAM